MCQVPLELDSYMFVALAKKATQVSPLAQVVKG